jgi:hypothetical protein
MKRVRSNYHALQVLKRAHPKLRKTIISNCDKELANCISECVLNVLNGNLPCNTRKLRKHKVSPRKFADRHVSLSGKKRLIVQRGGFLLPPLSAILPTIVGLSTRRLACYVRCTSARPSFLRLRVTLRKVTTTTDRHVSQGGGFLLSA